MVLNVILLIALDYQAKRKYCDYFEFIGGFITHIFTKIVIVFQFFN